MNFATKSPKTEKCNTMIYVVVYRLMNIVHSLATNENEKLKYLAQLYNREVVMRHEFHCKSYMIVTVSLQQGFGRGYRRSLA